MFLSYSKIACEALKVFENDDLLVNIDRIILEKWYIKTWAVPVGLDSIDFLL